MTRRVHGHSPGQVRRFVPTAFGNAADTSPVVVRLREPTEGERRGILAAIAMSSRPDGAPDFSRVRELQDDAIVRFVDGIENYSGANGEPIAMGEQLVTHGETEIYREVAEEIVRATRLSNLEKKQKN